MIKDKILSFILILSVLALSLCGCSSTAACVESELYALDTIITLSVYTDNEGVVGLAEDEIKRLESLFSVTDAVSDVYAVNSSSGNAVSVSRECFDLISESIAVSDKTGGLFDITVCPAVFLWGFTGSEYYVPTDKELEDVKSLIGYNNIILDKTSLTVKIPNDFSIDLGGVAKGCIADKAAKVLEENGVSSALLNFGGNIRLIGSKPNGDNWNIGIKSPQQSGYFATVKAENCTISTAGGYERYFEQDGKAYHHIINPFTAKPSDSDALSSTVIGDRGEICDALSTAVYVAGSQGIYDISAVYPDYSFILLTQDKVYVSSQLNDVFSLADTYSDLEIILI